MNPWIILFLAGLLEIVWALSMKASEGFSRPGYAALTGVAAFASFWLLGLAMRDLPLGTAYTVWVGIGAAGAVIFGMVWFGDPATLTRLAGVGLVLAGVGVLRYAG